MSFGACSMSREPKHGKARGRGTGLVGSQPSSVGLTSLGSVLGDFCKRAGQRGEQHRINLLLQSWVLEGSAEHC